MQKLLPVDLAQFDLPVNKMGFLASRGEPRDLSRSPRPFVDRDVRAPEDVRGVEGGKVPFRLTLLAVALFCTGFWALVAWLVLAL